MKVIEDLKRVSFDAIGAILSIVIVFLVIPYQYFPDQAKAGLITLVITKFILITCGNVHFFITRKLMYTYINFKTEKEWTNNVMIIVMYAIIVWGWARGG
jgi:uncharacterized membrane-anchored protein